MKKKIEDYFDFSNAPAATHGSSVVVGREMPIVHSGEYATRESVPAPVWQAPQIPDMYQQAVTLDGKEPAATPVQYMTQEVARQPVPTSFDPAFVDLTRPTTGPTTRPNYVPQQDPLNVLRDSSGAPVVSSNGNPFQLPNQTSGNVAGGKGGSGPNGGK